MATRTVRTSGESENDVRTIVAESAVQQFLDALDDADCRAILDATDAKAKTASEIADAFDLPLSTTYRKLDLLTEAGLLEERTRIRRSGKHASEYTRSIDEVVISLDADRETEVRVSQRKRSERTGSSVSLVGD
jgi:DNA-binding transcriptional ArsR family regulator